mmetsp:Transcript_29167/g.51000  ORF Transcript_29167/g.51000 Transcript_29167/m.51000 type:complete len:230 (+) Transcript_29167:110-799(+)
MTMHITVLVLLVLTGGNVGRRVHTSAGHSLRKPPIDGAVQLQTNTKSAKVASEQVKSITHLLLALAPAVPGNPCFLGACLPTNNLLAFAGTPKLTDPQTDRLNRLNAVLAKFSERSLVLAHQHLDEMKQQADGLLSVMADDARHNAQQAAELLKSFAPPNMRVEERVKESMAEQDEEPAEGPVNQGTQVLAAHNTNVFQRMRRHVWLPRRGNAKEPGHGQVQAQQSIAF